MDKITSREILVHEVAEAMQMRFDDCRPLLNLTTQEVGEWFPDFITFTCHHIAHIENQ